MARYLMLWRANPVVPSRTDPSEHLKLHEKMFAALDDLMKKGVVEEFGFFPDANSGYMIGKGEATDMFRLSDMAFPDILAEIHEIVPYEKGKEIMNATLKAEIEAAK